MIAKLLVLHFIADFLLQSREMGKTKSSNPSMLAGHLLIQWLVFLPFTNNEFATYNMVIHGIIDWNIWRGYKWLVGQRLHDSFGNKWKSLMQGKPVHVLMTEDGTWQYWEDHLFYSTIGLDQLLHMLTLVLLAGALL